MSDASRPVPHSSRMGNSLPGKGSPLVLWGVLAFVLLLAAGIAVTGVLGVMRDQAAMRGAQDRLVANHGLVPKDEKGLSPEYQDKDGGLLADPSTDPQELLDPDTLVLAHYTDADVDTQIVDWEGFRSYLAEATGKNVVKQDYLNEAEEIAAIKAGTIHVVALHAADAPYIVNNAGFIPAAVLGNEVGAHGNHLVIAVNRKSSIQKLADLRGQTLTCTAPDSITGYRAAIVVLLQEAGMRPNMDYFINFSFGQSPSILGLAKGEFEVAALSDDKLQSMLKEGSVATSDFRIIYESQVIPRLTIGYVCNLQPELASKIAKAALEFRNEAGAPDKTTGEPMRFFPVDYKSDFEFVRNIDNSFDPRFHKRTKAKRPELTKGA